MGLLDDLFDSGKKSKFEETMDSLMDKAVETASETFKTDHEKSHRHDQ